MKEYDHKKIEKKWQTIWEKKKIYQAKDSSKKPKFYGLIEFPYPSGSGLHVGHIRSNTAMDIISRKRRMEGFNVLYPIGWDAFGLPTENYAIKTGIQPSIVTKKNTDIFRKQLKAIGFSFDWSREINTTDPKYYKWTQWIFLQFLKKGLAYKAKMTINWCPKDKIGLANEEVVDGCCERCGTPVEKREKEQWMLAITKYADRLYKDLDDVNYLEKIKIQQRNWIGRSEGAEIEFKITHPSLTLPEGKGGVPGYHTTDPENFRLLQEKAKEMRERPTEAEKKLWQELKGNKNNFHFRQQHIINKFIVDFVCLSKNLIIEVDGDIHDLQREKDKERTDILETLGYKIIRFNNEEVLGDVIGVVKKIENELKVLPFGEDLGGVKVFTTRADTIFGAFAIILAPEHQLVQGLKSQITNWNEVKKYIEEAKKETDIERTEINKEKSGVELKGIKAINPINSKEIPVWIADFILVQYGTGAVFADMHDERDFEFAKKYSLPMNSVLEPIFIADVGENAIRKNLPFVRRNAICAVVVNPKDGKYLCVSWKKFLMHGFVTGGVEEGEDIVQGALREIREETGYKNVKLVKDPKIAIHSLFYHRVKEQNRWARFQYLFFELINEEQDPIEKKESDLHDIVWKSKNELKDFFSVVEGKFVLNILDSKSYVYTGEGVLINSDKFNGLTSEEARPKIVEAVGGKIVTKFKLRDWIFSRQRYWGEPIPVVHCEKCGIVPVPEKDLPVELPKVKNYQPTDSGESPLANIAKWVNVKCPKCKGKAKRETDTMPNWAGSSWYYLRYVDPKNNKEFASKKNLKYWLTPPPNPLQRKGEVLPFGEDIGGVDWYNGGNEHTTLHLLYSRFWHKFLFDQGLVPTSEPYKKRTSHGMILGEGGVKMSKSLGNIINPDDIVKIYGADTLRIYEMFMGPFDQSVAWSTESIIGSRRFIERVWNLQYKVQRNRKYDEFEIEKTVKKVTEDIEEMKFNTAISTLMIFVNEVGKNEFISQIAYEKFLKILSPFAPHVTEELWQNIHLSLTPSKGRGRALPLGEGLGGVSSIHLSDWPKWDENLTKDEKVKIMIQINGKVRGEIMIENETTEEEIKKQALAEETVLKNIIGKDVKKIIYVKNRLINIVV